MIEINGQRSEVSSQKSGFSRGHMLTPLPLALSLLYALLFALLRSRRGAAAEEGNPDRVSIDDQPIS